VRTSNLTSSHLRLGLQNGLFPRSFVTKVLYKFSFSPMRAHASTNLIALKWSTTRWVRTMKLFIM
jgi:hypothetical protein